MLEAARREAEDQKRDVVVGIVETHGRYDTGALLIGLELLPRRKVEHRGHQARGVRPRRARSRGEPELILVDELAHTNAPGSRHAEALAGRRGAARRGHRRLHDAQRAAPREPERRRRADHRRRRPRDGARRRARQGLRGAPRRPARRRAARAPAARARSTCPTRRRARARELLPRGQPHRPARARAAPHGRARRRARCAATRPRTASRSRGTRASASSSCVSPEPALGAPRPRRAADGDEPARRARSPCYVETPASLRMSAADRERLAENMRLAEQLGGETVTLRGEDARRGDRPLRAQAQRHEDRRRQADAPALARHRHGRRSSTRSSAGAARSTSTSSRAGAERPRPRRAPGAGRKAPRGDPVGYVASGRGRRSRTASRRGSSSAASSSPTS